MSRDREGYDSTGPGRRRVLSGGAILVDTRDHYPDPDEHGPECGCVGCYLGRSRP